MKASQPGRGHGSVFAIVVAAGSGRRLGASSRKAGVQLLGKPLAVWSLQSLERSGVVDAGVVVVHEQDLALAQRDWLPTLRHPELWTAVAGGAERSDSVKNGLERCPQDAALVLIHDAARPLVAGDDVAAVVQQAAQTGAAILAEPVYDTLKHAPSGVVQATVNRNEYWRAQTPQVFRRDLLVRAHRAAVVTETDDAMLVEALGEDVAVVPASRPNPKVTVQQDLEWVEWQLRGAQQDSEGQVS